MAFSLSPGAIAAAGDMWEGSSGNRTRLADQSFTGSIAVPSFSTGATAIAFSNPVNAVRALVYCKFYSALGTVFTVGNVATVWRLIVSDSTTVSLNTRVIATAVGPRSAHSVVLVGVVPDNDVAVRSARLQVDVGVAVDEISYDAQIDAVP